VADASWERWRPEIAKACDGTHWTVEAIERAIIEGRAQALLRDDCCLIVEIQDYPAERACQVMWAAGDLDAILRAEPHLAEWAKARNCTEMLVESRPAWARALKPLGYEPWSMTVRKAL
jgi:hypothetical protein